MIIREIKPAGSDPALERYATRHHLLFHSPHWLSCYASGSVRQCAILNNNQEIIGCFLYYLFRKAGLNFIITPPWMPHIALSFVNPAESVVGRGTYVKDIIRAVSDYFVGLRSAHISINLPAHITDTQPFIWNGFSSRVRHTYLLDLGHTEEQLRQNLSSEKRKSLNKAQKDNIRVMPGSDTALVASLVLQSLTRSGQAKNVNVLRAIIGKFSGDNRSITTLAYQGDKAIAAAFCMVEGDTALYLFGGYDDERSHHGAGVSCMWQCILEAKRRGLSFFDFEGSMNPQIERYFREFGGQLTAYQCVEKTGSLVKLLMRLKGHKPL